MYRATRHGMAIYPRQETAVIARAPRGPLTRRAVAVARERVNDLSRDENGRISSVVSWPCAVPCATVCPLSVIGFSLVLPYAVRDPRVRKRRISTARSPGRRTGSSRTPPSLRAGWWYPRESDAGAHGTGDTTAVAAAAAAAAARPVRLDGTAVPPVRAQVLRASVQQPGPVRPGRRLRDRRRVRVPVPGGRQRASTARPDRPPQERLSGRALEHHRCDCAIICCVARP